MAEAIHQNASDGKLPDNTTIRVAYITTMNIQHPHLPGPDTLLPHIESISFLYVTNGEISP